MLNPASASAIGRRTGRGHATAENRQCRLSIRVKVFVPNRGYGRFGNLLNDMVKCGQNLPRGTFGQYYGRARACRRAAGSIFALLRMRSAAWRLSHRLNWRTPRPLPATPVQHCHWEGRSFSSLGRSPPRKVRRSPGASARSFDARDRVPARGSARTRALRLLRGAGGRRWQLSLLRRPPSMQGRIAQWLRASRRTAELSSPTQCAWHAEPLVTEFTVQASPSASTVPLSG